MRARRVGVVLVLAVLASAAQAQQPGQPGVKKRRPLPSEYGRVVLNNHSEAAGLAPVVFDHWLHRAKFTCRLCHVDIGFGMKARSTDIRAADNIAGQYCGACHNEQRVFGNKKMFPSCAKPGSETRQTCVRCHSLGKPMKPEYDFATFTQKLPRERFGNGIDWEKAEVEKLITPLNFLDGVSIRRPALPAQKDFALQPKVEGMPDIVFSHAKHTTWNGCEVCHPELFAPKKGVSKYSMVQMFDGQFCGVCHTTVAFPLLDCQRCHAKPVQ